MRKKIVTTEAFKDRLILAVSGIISISWLIIEETWVWRIIKKIMVVMYVPFRWWRQKARSVSKLVSKHMVRELVESFSSLSFARCFGLLNTV